MKILLRFIFGPWFSIEHGFSIFVGGDAPAAPDYTPVANANDHAADLAYQAANDRLNFDKSVYADAKPYVQTLQNNATATAAQQAAIANTTQQSADLQLQQFKDKGIPAENQMYEDAANYGTAADQETQAGTAANQVISQGNAQKAAATTALQSMGVRPDSGAGQAATTGVDISTAANAANAANIARTTARDKGIALRAGAANFAAGTPSAAATGFSTSIAAGNSSTGNLTSASTAGLPSAAVVDGGYTQQGSAANTGVQSALGMGNILNTGYGISSQASASADAGLGSLVGSAGMAAATIY